MAKSDTDKVDSIIHNKPLASALCRSIETARHSPFLGNGRTKRAWNIFESSLNAASRDIEIHPLGKLFRRFIEYGPHNPDEPEAMESDGKTILSDPECGLCVEFIFSHMINRFKGELAELLALEPCISLVKDLKRKKELPLAAKMCWGDTIKERRWIAKSKKWGNFAKGADELMVEKHGTKSVVVHGVAEVKSMVIAEAKAFWQISKHIKRLSGGLRLASTEWPANRVRLASGKLGKKLKPMFVKIMVIPSSWKLSREWSSEKTPHGRQLVFPKPTEPPVKTTTTQLDHDSWCIKLAWSEEALNQASYEMTFWYMSQVGKAIYEKKPLPKGWEYMTPEEAGYNAVKMMLYYIPLRCVSKRQLVRAIKLYNVYSFGYPLGIDGKDMLWPEDFPDKTN
jgi:hypothetical protein